MLRKLAAAVAITAFLAATSARAADGPLTKTGTGYMTITASGAAAADGPLTIVVGSGQVEAATGAAPAGSTLVVETGPTRGQGELIPATPPSEYWLGLFATNPSPALQSQLKLPKDQGLLVEGLQPDSPAAKAGIQQYDILLKGNDKPLNSIQDLMQVIDHVKDGKLTLDLLRAGKHETVTATPAKRPANEPGVIGGFLLPEGAGVSGLIQNLNPNVTEGRPLEIRVIRPGDRFSPAAL